MKNGNKDAVAFYSVRGISRMFSLICMTQMPVTWVLAEPEEVSNVLDTPVSSCMRIEMSDSFETPMELSLAARWAVYNLDATLLKALFSAGVKINEPVVDCNGDSLLFLAVGMKNEKMTDFLLKNGADRGQRDIYHNRPIDIALDEGATNICNLLAKTKPEHEKCVDGLPVEMLTELFKSYGRTNVVFVVIGDKSPSEEMLTYLRSDVWPNARPLSKSLINKYSNKQGQPVNLTAEEQQATLFEFNVCQRALKTSQ